MRAGLALQLKIISAMKNTNINPSRKTLQATPRLQKCTNTPVMAVADGRQQNDKAAAVQWPIPPSFAKFLTDQEFTLPEQSCPPEVSMNSLRE